MKNFSRNIYHKTQQVCVLIALILGLSACSYPKSEFVSPSNIKNDKAYILYSLDFSHIYKKLDDINMYSSDISLNFNPDDSGYHLIEVPLGYHGGFSYKNVCNSTIDSDLKELSPLNIQSNKIYYIGHFNHQMTSEKPPILEKVHLNQKDLDIYIEKNSPSIAERLLALSLGSPLVPFSIFRNENLLSDPFSRFVHTKQYYSSKYIHNMFSEYDVCYSNDNKRIDNIKFSNHIYNDIIDADKNLDVQLSCYKSQDNSYDTNTFSLQQQRKFLEAQHFLQQYSSNLGKNSDTIDIIDFSQEKTIYKDEIMTGDSCSSNDNGGDAGGSFEYQQPYFPPEGSLGSGSYDSTLGTDANFP